MANRHNEKMLNITNYQGKCKSKWQWHINAHLLAWPPSRNKRQGCDDKGSLTHCWWEYTLLNHYRKHYGGSKNIKNKSILLSRNSTSEYISKENENRISMRHYICTPTFIAALFTIDKIWKPFKWPSMDEWLKNMWYLCIMKYYLAMKREFILPFFTTWVDLKHIILIKGKSDIDKYCMTSLTCEI